MRALGLRELIDESARPSALPTPACGSWCRLHRTSKRCRSNASPASSRAPSTIRLCNCEKRPSSVGGLFHCKNPISRSRHQSLTTHHCKGR
jgi:hypothetical protein